MIKTMNDFKEVLSRLPGLSIVEDGNKIILNYKWQDIDKNWELEKAFVKDMIKNLGEKKIKDETILYDEYTYEVLVKFETTRPIPLRIFLDEKRILKEDMANGITYELSKPTDEYMLFILDVLGKSEYLRDISRPLPLFRIRRICEENLDFFEFLNEIITPRLYTLKIRSLEPMSANKFSDFATAFLFNLSYNLDIAVIEVRFLHELSRYRFGKIRRSRIDEIEPPRRIYIHDLVYHYQMAISTDSIPLQFLSFYHIIEHFFYDVYHSELLNEIRAKITSPDFSYKRKRDLESLVKLISNKVKYKNGVLTYNEQEALYLTLKKYVKLENLAERLKEFDEQLIDYYKKEKSLFLMVVLLTSL